jgi:hypothetical protein
MDAKETVKMSFREAAQKFDGTPKSFRQLAGYKDEIAELRRKGASYDAISELLKMDGISVSWKTIARFCHATFDSGRFRKRRATLPKLSVLPPNSNHSGENSHAALKERQESVGSCTRRKRGPRIADSKNL